MGKFSSKPAPANVRAPIATTGARTLTHEGGLGYVRDAKSELFLLAVANMVGEETFYERAGERDARFRALVHQVVAEDPAWVAAFVPYLRDTMQMRSASVVMAAEYVRAGGPGGRKVVASALSRADEPAEILAYWAQEHGRRFPQPLKRGVADAVQRLYNERAALKYDGVGRAWRMGDVLELVHPKPCADWQSELFCFLLDARHHDGEPLPGPLMTYIPRDPETGEPITWRGTRDRLLPLIAARRELEALPVPERRANLHRIADAAMTWESLSGWLQGPMDAQAWEAVIPSMGYMALLRNLRNFEQAGVSDEMLWQVAARLANRDEVRKSRQFPLRFLSAYKAATSERFSYPLEQAIEHSVENIPHFPGRTLILIDVSGSMTNATLSARSTLSFKEGAGLFGLALAKRCEQAEVYAYDTNSWKIEDGPLLRVLAQLLQIGGGGTYTMDMLAHYWAGQDRIVILTDEQAHPGRSTLPPISVPIYTFNLAGYRAGHMAQGEKGSYVFGGLSDAAFTMLALLEQRRDASWPFIE